MSTPDGWREVWERRTLDRSRGTPLSQLIEADGHDTAFGEISESAWRDFVGRRAQELGVQEGTSVYEVGCGAGAFLLVLEQLGCHVGGLDRSVALVDLARESIPAGHFDVREAIELATKPKVDVMVSCGVFFYFPTLEYAAAVITAMAARATRAVAILDVPDRATRDGALAHRISLAGGETAYRERYDHLEHLYFDRSWIIERLLDAGLTNVRVGNQDIPGYGNSPFRFNVWGFVEA